MADQSSHLGLSTLTGSPWRDMRMHMRLHGGGGMRVQRVADVIVHGRNPEWILSAQGNAGLTIPASREEVERTPRGTKRIFISGEYREGGTWIRIECADRELENVFLRFCESILSGLESGKVPGAAISEALEQFRQLFEKPGTGVDREKIIGLMSELVVLEWLLKQNLDPIPHWRGPFGETHDFLWSSVHLEVKALPGSGAQRFRVANLQQLQEPGDGQLFLVGVPMKPGKETIGERVSRVYRLMPLSHIEEFERALLAAGCSVPVPDQWNSTGFSPGEIGTWRVEAGFPRIVPESLVDGVVPEGVSEVRYTVSLEAARAYCVAKEEVVKAIRAGDAKS